MRYYVLAAVLALMGGAAYAYMASGDRYDVMSNTATAMRAGVSALLFGGAIWSLGLATGGLARDPASPRIYITGIIVYSVGVFAVESWLVRVRRRALVRAWENGAGLPGSVAEDDIRRWAERHPS